MLQKVELFFIALQTLSLQEMCIQSFQLFQLDFTKIGFIQVNGDVAINPIPVMGATDKGGVHFTPKSFPPWTFHS